MEDERKDTLREQPEQAEQPETEKKEANSGMILGMCLGMAMGVAIGAATKNLGLWMPIGMCMGMALGVAFDSQKKKKNEQDDGNDQPQA